MPISFGGMASGIDTEEIIKKLVNVEKRPIVQWQNDIRKYNSRKKALSALQSHLGKLRDSAKQLYGFRAAYLNKKAISSSPDIISATANKKAEKGIKRIIVKQLAGTNKISSDPITKETELKPGKIALSINGETRKIKFSGGSLNRLHEIIQEKASDILNTTYINTMGETYVFTLESKIPGEKGEIGISGDKDLLQSIGLVKGEKGASKEKVTLVFDKKYFTSYIGKQETGPQNGSLKVSSDGKNVTLKGTLWQEYILPLETPAKEDTLLEFGFSYKEPPKEEDEALPFRIEMGPEEKTVIKGIELHSYNISRVRPIEQKKKEKQFDSVIGVGVVAMDKTRRIEKIYSVDIKAKGKREIPIGKDFQDKKISKVIFYSNTGTVEFSDTHIITPQKGTGQYEPKNVISKAANARLKLDGIDITRDKNDGITDIIKGVTLSLKRSSESPVTITIESDEDNAIDKIKKFVDSYNSYLDFTKELTVADRTAKAKNYRQKESKSGLFVGDMTILRLENSVKQTVSAAYPSKADQPVKIITQIGISTGELNAAWDTIKAGKLVVDETKLREVIAGNPDGVMQFFGSDTDGDNRTDNGLGYQMVQVLQPYTASGNNIIKAKISYEDTTIERTNERIERHEEHVARYEDKLRRKFATMEQSISGAKAQGNWLNQQIKGMKGGD
ncbi:MAG TPA: flagellar filament capping protein FliD [Spirochaetota bacterium]|nr:flagellar filament capping protein FliD [Spirochaetota bacterium]HQO00773.1 flagellar filament capping protein FliD [Spirochaetota bacterium]HQP49030.1 flagellar filament capping protein FliD [Spirochaetota bacterium]